MTTKLKTRKGRVQTHINTPSKTKQSFADETNINTIMSRYEKSGIVEHLNKNQAVYGDYSDIPDYQASLNLVIKAEELFMGLPSAIRSRFDNDPGLFLDFTQNPENLDKMREMGLAPPAKQKPPEKPSEPAHQELKASSTTALKDDEVITSKSQVKTDK